MLRFYQLPDGRVHALIEESQHRLSSGGYYYEGFGTPRGMSRSCIEPLQIGGGFLETCQEIGEHEARFLHPELMRHLDARMREGCFYTRLLAKDIEVGMHVLIGQSFHEISEIFPDDTMLVKYVPGGMVLLEQEQSMVRKALTSHDG